MRFFGYTWIGDGEAYCRKCGKVSMFISKWLSVVCHRCQSYGWFRLCKTSKSVEFSELVK